MYLASPKILSEDLSYSINRVVPWSVFQLMLSHPKVTLLYPERRLLGGAHNKLFLLKYLFFNLFFLKKKYKWKRRGFVENVIVTSEAFPALFLCEKRNKKFICLKSYSVSYL